MRVERGAVGLTIALDGGAVEVVGANDGGGRSRPSLAIAVEAGTLRVLLPGESASVVFAIEPVETAIVVGPPLEMSPLTLDLTNPPAVVLTGRDAPPAGWLSGREGTRFWSVASSGRLRFVVFADGVGLATGR